MGDNEKLTQIREKGKQLYIQTFLLEIECLEFKKKIENLID